MDVDGGLSVRLRTGFGSRSAIATFDRRRDGPGVGAVDDEMFDDAVRQSLLAMTRVAKRLAPDADPEDVVQESLVRAWSKRHQFDPSRGSATAWLIAITVSRARDARTKRVRDVHAVEAYSDEQQPPATHANAAAIVAIDLAEAMSKLSRRQRTAIELRYFIDLSISDVAQVMGCSEGTVKSTLFDARQRLSKVLGDANGD